MFNLGSAKCLFFYTLFIVLQTNNVVVLCYQHKVGDLNCWNIPVDSNRDVYSKWSKNHVFKVGDSLLFLYPPSQDSVIQVTPTSYKSCNMKNPIMYINDGNSLFNITQPGEFYFTSGEPGHCSKGQKLHISLAGKGAIVYAPSEGPTAMSDTADGPSNNNHQVFGLIPTPNTSSQVIRFSPFWVSLIGFAIWVSVT